MTKTTEMTQDETTRALWGLLADAHGASCETVRSLRLAAEGGTYCQPAEEWADSAVKAARRCHRLIKKAMDVNFDAVKARGL